MQELAKLNTFGDVEPKRKNPHDHSKQSVVGWRWATSDNHFPVRALGRIRDNRIQIRNIILPFCTMCTFL